LVILTRSWAIAQVVKVMANTIAGISGNLRLVEFIGSSQCHHYMKTVSHREHRERREIIVSSVPSVCCGGYSSRRRVTSQSSSGRVKDFIGEFRSSCKDVIAQGLVTMVNAEPRFPFLLFFF
jgi:hypothetical protein